MGDTGAASLVDALRVNKTTRILSLGINDITDIGANAFADLLKVNKVVNILQLSHNNISTKSCDLLESNWTKRRGKLDLTNQREASSSTGIRDTFLDPFGKSFLPIIFNNKVNSIKDWIEKGNNVNHADNHGRTVLWYAMYFGRKDIIKLVLNAKGQAAYLNIADKGGFSPFGLLKFLKKSEEGSIVEACLDFLQKRNQELESTFKVLQEQVIQTKKDFEGKTQILETKLLTTIEKQNQIVEEKLQAINKRAQDVAEAKVVKAEAKRLKQESQLKEAEEAKVIKEATKLKALEKEKVKAYESKADLNMTKIFIEGEPREGALADYNQTIRQVSELIKNGNDRLQEHTKKGVLLLGDTGAGKSTLAHLLSGRKLQAIVEDQSGELVIDVMQPLADIVIGHKMASETKVPNKCFANDTVIWDCAGFNDTYLAQEIGNSFYIKKLFEITDEMKFVLVVPEYSLMKNKGNHFLATLASFIKTFSNMEAMGGSISLVITQVPPQKKLQHIQNSIEKILSDNQSVTQEQKTLVNCAIHTDPFNIFIA